MADNPDDAPPAGRGTRAAGDLRRAGAIKKSKSAQLIRRPRRPMNCAGGEDASGEWPRELPCSQRFHGNGETTMQTIKTLAAKLVRDEQGGEVLEYALIAGLIVVAAIAIIGSVGSKVLARWTSLNTSM